MSYRLSILITTFLFACCLIAMQAPKPKKIPKFEGDGNSQHDNQPAFCINTDKMGYEHNCSCKGMFDKDRSECDKDLPGEGEDRGGGESAKCSVYCRKSACRCQSPCTT